MHWKCPIFLWKKEEGDGGHEPALRGYISSPEFISRSDSYFTELFNSLHLIQKQISSCVDLKCPAIDIQHFSHILHIQGRARQQQLKSMLQQVWSLSRAYIAALAGSKSDQEFSSLDRTDINFNPYRGA